MFVEVAWYGRTCFCDAYIGFAKLSCALSDVKLRALAQAFEKGEIPTEPPAP